jgi:histidinol-phosphate phosphatase family protein
VFLDRDGVVIDEVHYLSHPKQLRLVPGTARAIKNLRAAGLKVILVTNQSGVARGYLTLGTLKKIHQKLSRQLAERGAELDAIYFCPHGPDDGCACRKPKSAMLEKARRRFGLDLSRSWLVGDTTTDVKTAKDAGCGALLVRTGKGGKDGVYRVKADKTFKDAAAASKWILTGLRGDPPRRRRPRRR